MLTITWGSQSLRAAVSLDKRPVPSVEFHAREQHPAAMVTLGGQISMGGGETGMVLQGKEAVEREGLP